MMVHPLIDQLRFTRNEWLRALAGVTDAEARRRFLPMNCISWNIGHLAWQEQRYWLIRLQGQTLIPSLNELVGYGQPAVTPPLAEMLEAWHTIIQASDPYLDTLTSQKLQEPIYVNGQLVDYTAGSLLQRVLDHDWYHIGENMAIRQMLGHTNLP
ncbi:MAG: DinB family protein, partial [Chloroflexi bacterium]|nr:DinB family protein [Chloroflexota bacterium]